MLTYNVEMVADKPGFIIIMFGFVQVLFINRVKRPLSHLGFNSSNRLHTPGVPFINYSARVSCRHQFAQFLQKDG